jgi:hypothetical protein
MNKFLLKTTVIAVSLMSNMVSFGMQPSAHELCGFSQLNDDSQCCIIRFIPCLESLNKFGLTSTENYKKVALYKEQQKNLTKQYLYLMHKGDIALAQQIEQDNPSLMTFYCFPRFYSLINKRKIQYRVLKFDLTRIELDENLVMKVEVAPTKCNEKLFLKKQPFADIDAYSGFNPQPLDIACLVGDCDLVVKLLRNDNKYSKDNVDFYDLVDPFMIAINEGNLVLARLLLDAINQISGPKNRLEFDRVVFNFETLQMLKLLGNKDAFLLMIDRIPSFSETTDLFSKQHKTLLELMKKDDLFNVDDLSLIQRKIDEEPILRKHDDQHCTIL